MISKAQTAFSGGRNRAESVPPLGLVVPVRDERENLDPLLKQLYPLVGTVIDQICFVESGSTDGTLARLHELADQYPWLLVRECAVIGDLAAAWREGIQALHGAQLIGFMDADLCHDPECFRDWVALLVRQQNAAAVIGSRFGNGLLPTMNKKIYRRAITLAMQRLFRFTTGATVADPAHGFRLVRSSSLQRFLAAEKACGAIVGNSWMLAMTAWFVHSAELIVEEPIHYGDRTSGADKLIARREGWRFLRWWIRGRSRLLHFSRTDP